MLPIVYCCNEKIFNGLFLSMESIVRRSGETFQFLILTMDYTQINKSFTPVSDSQIEMLDSMVKKFNLNNEVKKFDLTNQFKQLLGNSKNSQNKNYTPYAMLRLLLYQDIFSNYSKVIYLDVDTMANKDIKQLFDIDIDEYELAMALDYLGKNWIAKDYCNSGVVLFNLDMCREKKTLQNCIELLNKKIFAMPDQSALHHIVKKKYILDSKYNNQFKFDDDTVIKHFSKGIKWLPIPHSVNIKQWNKDKVINNLKIHAFDQDYKYCEQFINLDN